MLDHRWDITPREAIALQRELASRVIVQPLEHAVRTIAGTDCAFVGKDRILAAAVLVDAESLEILATSDVAMPVKFPYVPGLLSFREAPAILEALGRLPVRPDLLMLDGQGLAHPRGLGIASHVGLWMDLPAIGVAKSRLCGEHRPVGPRRGQKARLMLNGSQVGLALRTQDRVQPLYVSVGHHITLAEAAAWTLRAAPRFRLPEPTRRAHMLVTRIKTRAAGGGESSVDNLRRLGPQ